MNRSLLMFLYVLTFCAGVNLRAQQQYTIATCPETFRPKDYVGGRFKLLIPKNTTVHRGKDIDYSNYSIGYSVRKKTYWLSGIFGPMATSGNVPNDLLTKSTDVTQRTWKRGDFEGVDAKGKLPNGNLWRYFGQFGESITYEDVPPEAALFFDRLLDNVCYYDRR